MSNWTTDADEIREIDHYKNSLLFQTKEISEFLSDIRSRVSFVIGSKGTGKTFLLISKRVQLQNKNYLCLPQKSLRDIILANVVFSKDSANFFSNYINWSSVWQGAILLSLCKNLDIEVKGDGTTLEAAVNNEGYHRITHYFSEILISCISSRQFYFEYTKDLQRHLLPLLRKIQRPVAFFIDKVDESFEEHMFGGSVSASARGEINPEIWYSVQIGLIDAIYEICSANHNVKGFAAIRKKVFHKMKTMGRLYSQWLGKTIVLDYTKSDLKELFIRYIRDEETDNLSRPKVLGSEPIRSFIGLKKIVNCYVKKYEDIFMYILRHTFCRPRDLMIIGGMISLIDASKRTGATLKESVDKASLVIWDDYAKTEVGLDVDVFDFKKLLSAVPSNVLKSDDLGRICCGMNGNDVCCSCNSCKMSHIFCKLYRMGLLGVLERSGVKGKFLQKFLLPGDVSVEDDVRLPESQYYFLHPILYSKIFEYNGNFVPVVNNVIGYGYPWKGDVDTVKIVGTHFRQDPVYEALSGVILDDMSAEGVSTADVIDRSEFKIVVGSLLNKNSVAILDVGCGAGPIISVLCEMDSDQLKTLSYVGVNHPDTVKIDRYIKDKKFESLVRSCLTLTFEQFRMIKVEADVVFLVDTLHHLNIENISYIISKIINSLPLNASFYIYEIEKIREVAYPWGCSDFRLMFSPFSFVQVNAAMQKLKRDGRDINIHVACITRTMEGDIGLNFKDIVYAMYEDKALLLKKNKDEIRNLPSVERENQDNVQKLAEITAMHSELTGAMIEFSASNKRSV